MEKCFRTSLLRWFSVGLMEEEVVFLGVLTRQKVFEWHLHFKEGQFCIPV